MLHTKCLICHVDFVNFIYKSAINTQFSRVWSICRLIVCLNYSVYNYKKGVLGNLCNFDGFSTNNQNLVLAEGPSAEIFWECWSWFVCLEKWHQLTPTPISTVTVDMGVKFGVADRVSYTMNNLCSLPIADLILTYYTLVYIYVTSFDLFTTATSLLLLHLWSVCFAQWKPH